MADKVNGRAKGSRFERVLAKKFEAWWGRRVSRTPLSGGWGNAALFDTAGDLVCQGGWPFVVEAKCQEGWFLEQILKNDKCPILAWWKQATQASLGHKKKKMPLLVFTRNRQPEYLMVRKEDFHRLTPTWTPLGSMFEVYMENTMDAVYILLLQDFLENITPPKPSPNNKRGPLPRPIPITKTPKYNKPRLNITGTKRRK